MGKVLTIGREYGSDGRAIAREAAQAAPLVERGQAGDEVRNTLDDLDRMESGLPEHENDVPDYGIDDHTNE